MLRLERDLITLFNQYHITPINLFELMELARTAEKDHNHSLTNQQRPVSRIRLFQELLELRECEATKRGHCFLLDNLFEVVETLESSFILRVFVLVSARLAFVFDAMTT